jgi:hypothetical protein
MQGPEFNLQYHQKKKKKKDPVFIRLRGIFIIKDKLAGAGG